jgi:hypothetical protein
MVLQHLDFRENGIPPNPDCNGKLPIFIGTWNGKQENGLEKVLLITFLLKEIPH